MPLKILLDMHNKNESKNVTQSTNIDQVQSYFNFNYI